MKYQTSLFLFHRDLRLDDNTGLQQALQQSKNVIAAFILDDAQLKNNEYCSNNAVQFMIESLLDLDQKLQKRGGKLYCFRGETLQVLQQLIVSFQLSAIFSNADYTPFSRKRDGAIAELCNEYLVPFMRIHDALLVYPNEITTNQGGIYTVFTPFKNKAKTLLVTLPQSNSFTHFYSDAISLSIPTSTLFDLFPYCNPQLRVHGGRTSALEQLQTIDSLENYDETRNIPALKGTSFLSAHLKFGTISAREVYSKVQILFGEQHAIISELYWRDFFTHIAYHFPYIFSGAFHKKYDKLQWSQNQDFFKAWCTGTTGFPIVDAGMRELNRTGFMHNRVRMITASFLVKHLHIHWQWGEKYFAQQLVDYDPAVNNGNWQWVASTGCDAQPYFRIFNPWSQQKNYDPDCLYVKRWIPELSTVPVKQLHTWYVSHKDFSLQYPAPIVDHVTEVQQTKKLYAECF